MAGKGENSVRQAEMPGHVIWLTIKSKQHTANQHHLYTQSTSFCIFISVDDGSKFGSSVTSYNPIPNN